MAGGMTPKQRRFVEEYLVDLNGAAAARRAGYSERTAKEVAAENLTKPNVMAAIQSALAERSARTQVTADRVLEELALIAFSDIGQVLDFRGSDVRLHPACEIPEAARRAISSVKVRRHVEGQGDAAREVEVSEFRLYDKLSALEKAGKHIGMWPSRVDVSGTLGLEHSGEIGGTSVEDHVRAAAAAVERLGLAHRRGDDPGAEGGGDPPGGGEAAADGRVRLDADAPDGEGGP